MEVQVLSSASKVLVINDEAPLRLLVRVNLEAEGMEVFDAADGPAGIEVARLERPDLILVDTYMPGPDGWQVTEMLRGEFPLVFLAPIPANRYAGIVRAFDVGAADYVTAPFNPLELADRIRSVLEMLARGEGERMKIERLAALEQEAEAPDM